jgi:hypothetical protein
VVTRDEVRKLIGGYATGTLTEAEKKLLFEAALEDQDLFDELVREQALKEALDEPGAKQRLIASLAPGEIVWWRRPWVWSAVSSAVVAALALGWIFRPIPAPVVLDEIARLEPKSAVAQPTNPSAAVDLPAAKPAQKRVSPPVNRQVTPPVTPAATLDRKEPPAGQFADKRRDAAPQTKAAGGGGAGAGAGIGRVAAPPPAQEQVQVQAQSAQIQVAPFADSGQRNQISQGAVAGAAPAPPAPALRSTLMRPARLSFDYSLGSEELVFTFASNGYFSIHFSPGLDTIVDSRVTAGSTRREHIPNNATEAAIVFSANPQTTSGGVSLVRETKTGTAEDPSGVRIELLLKFYP